MGIAERHMDSGRIEDIARGLFTVKDTRKGRSGTELSGRCPVHEDKNPSFTFNTDKDVCFCFGCGFKGDLAKLWWTVNHHTDEKEGFQAFCREFGISENFDSPAGDRPPKKKKPKLPPLEDAYAKLEPLPDDWVRKLEQLRGWSPGAMMYLGLRLQSHYQEKNTGKIKRIRKPARVAIPIYDDHGKIRNIRNYRPGKPRPEDTTPKIISWGTAYGEARLFPPDPRPEDTVLLCEGESDMICALSHGFNAITQTSKPKKWNKRQLKKFQDRDVVIAFDADQPGDMYAREYAGPEICKVARSVRILTWPDFMGRRDDGLWPEKNGQDLTDFFKRHGKTDIDLQRLMDAAEHFTPPEPEIDPQQYYFFKHGVNGRLSFKARLLAETIMADKKVLHCPDTGLLYRWNGRYWEEYFEDHLKATALKMLGNEAKQAWVTDAIFQIKALSTIPHGRQLNDQTDYICVKNGMLNIKTMRLEPHSPGFYASYELDVTFNPDSKDKCHRFLRFLRETVQTPQVISQVQEFFGYCFLRANPFAKCLLLKGPGSDGKSTLLKIIRKIIGPGNCASVSFNEMEDQFLRSALYQKSVNICTEVGSKAIESPYFKAISSGDPVNAAFKHKNTFTFSSYCKLIFAANEMPRVLDNSEGFYRRILPIWFKRQFHEGDPDTDPFLDEKLEAEKSEIFHWALVGLRRLLKNRRFTPCQETEQLLLEYKRLNNPIICFVEDACVIEAGTSVAKADIFAGYEKYCRKNNYRPYSAENFFRELYAAWNTLKSTRPRTPDGTRKYTVDGIRIKSEVLS